MMFKTSCIASHSHYNNLFMHYRCVFYLLQCYVLVGLDQAKPIMHLYLHVTCSCHAHVPSSFYICYIVSCCCFFDYLSLSPSLSLFFTLVASWHLSASLLCPETLFVSEHLLLLLHLTPLPLMSGSVMRGRNRTSWRTFHDAAFIRNAKSEGDVW